MTDAVARGEAAYTALAGDMAAAAAIAREPLPYHAEPTATFRLAPARP